MQPYQNYAPLVLILFIADTKDRKLVSKNKVLLIPYIAMQDKKTSVAIAS